MKMFARKPVLDEASAAWIVDIFEWSLNHFDRDIFKNHTVLVLPDNRHFPGRAESVDDMANLVLEKVLEYAAMSHWPCKAINQAYCEQLELPALHFPDGLRLIEKPSDKSELVQSQIAIPFDPNLVRQPEALISSFSHGLSQYLVAATSKIPPGGEQNWIYATEVIAVFMGFGLMLCNTAVTHQVRSCASCAPRKTYSSALSQFDLCYALAVFSQLKGIDAKEVTPHLKKPLRGYFKRALKEVSPSTHRLLS